MMKKVCIGMALLGWFWSFHAIAQDAGWINSMKGKSEHYQLKRGNESLPVGFFVVLQVGDEISVNSKQAAVELRLRGGTQPIEVTMKNSPVRIGEENRVPALWEKQWAWIKTHLNKWHKLTQSVITDKQGASNQTSCTSVSMPLLENVRGPALLTAGEQPLYLQWYGGTAPYRVLIQQRHYRLINKINLSQMIETKPIDFEANKSYRVQVFDAKGRFFMGGFRVVEPTQKPSLPKTLLDANLPKDFLQTMWATWLTMQENDNWWFAAYQKVVPLVEYRPAQLLKKVLSQGAETLTCRGVRG